MSNASFVSGPRAPVPDPACPARLVTGAAAPCLDVGTAVGNTPVLWIDRPFTSGGSGFWAKLEGQNPGGIKDRVALHMVARARERGELQPGGAIVESTSGTFGLGLALAGIVHGHPVTLVSDPGLELCMQRLLAAYGARIEMVTEPHPTGGWQEARRLCVDQLVASDPGAFCPDQYSNPDAVAGYGSLALELVAQLGRVDAVVCAVGTGGHSAGITRVLRGFSPHLRLIGVDATGSRIFGQPARPRLMRGLGSSIVPRNVDHSLFDEVHWVNPAEAVWACRQLARAHYVTGGWSVGAVALVAGWLAQTLPPDVRIVAVFPDGPQRYFDSVYDDDYCRRHGLLGSAPAAEPDEIDHAAAREVTRWTRCRRVEHPGTAAAGGMGGAS